MTIDGWDEIRTAFEVARAGTVSGAAQTLGVHHATVIRHIDALEGRLGVKLFQRHARGYTPTEAGEDLLRVARVADASFAQLASRLRGMGDTVEGELAVTMLPGLSPMVIPAVARFQMDHPGLRVRCLTGERVLRLETGEAHVAIRGGPAPEEPDNVVQRLGASQTALYAAPAYLDAHGRPTDEAALLGHAFVGPEDAAARAPFYRWLAEAVPADRVVFRTSDPRAAKYAVMAGVGLGFLPVWEARTQPGLVEVIQPRADWSSPLWLVTHVDLHRTAKVQAFLKHLKAAASDWAI